MSNLRRRFGLALIIMNIFTCLSIVSANAIGYNNPVGTQTPAQPGLLTIATGTFNGAISFTDGYASSSAGLLAVSDGGGTSAALTQTATLLSNGTIAVNVGADSTANQTYCVMVTGGNISIGGGLVTMSAPATSGCAGNNTPFGFGIRPNPGISTFSIKLYRYNGPYTLDSSAGATLVGQVVVTVANYCCLPPPPPPPPFTGPGTVPSISKSRMSFTASWNREATTSGQNVGRVPYNFSNYAAIQINDSQGNPMNSAPGVITATATNGALVSLSNSTDPSGQAYYSSTFLLVSTTIGGIGIVVKDPTSNALTTVVTVSDNGYVIARSTFSFIGAVARISLSDPHTSRISPSGPFLNMASLWYYDSSGAKLYPTPGDRSWPVLLGSPANNITAASGATPGGVTAIINPIKNSTEGYALFACASTPGTGTIGLYYVNFDGSIVYSNTLKVNCFTWPRAH